MYDAINLRRLHIRLSDTAIIPWSGGRSISLSSSPSGLRTNPHLNHGGTSCTCSFSAKVVHVSDYWYWMGSDRIGNYSQSTVGVWGRMVLRD